MSLDPTLYGLTRSTVLEDHHGGIALVLNRKSRIIMADGKRILAKIMKVREQAGAVAIVVKTTAPVCSKTLRFLADHDVAVVR